MKAVIFGGSGFIGSHLADYLLEKGFKVRLFDIYESKYLKSGHEMIIGDILNYDDVVKAVMGCDYVYNFAGIADINEAFEKPFDTVKLNILGNVHILEAVKKHGCKRFIYASTLYVYSDSGGFYKCSKQASEIYIETYNRHFDIDYTIMRFGTIYGPRADNRNSVYRYISEALNDKKITFKGTGEELREYIHVRDVAHLCYDVLDDEYKNQNVLISGHTPMRTRDLLSMISEIITPGVKITYKPIENPNEIHYKVTPFTFSPKIAKKLLSNYYLDMGQGLLECINEIYENQNGGEFCE
jgi:UDP-glucose 4-epimerase